MKTDPLDENIESRISVNPDDIAEAERIENDAVAMLRLVDLLFFLRDNQYPPS